VDIPIIIPSQNTARIQECHITVGHLICELVEKDLE
jgi:D-sedoheptulose 7-phosphate isomerase